MYGGWIIHNAQSFFTELLFLVWRVAAQPTTITIKSTLTIIRLNSSNVVLNEFS